MVRRQNYPADRNQQKKRVNTRPYIIALEYQQRVSLWVEPMPCKMEVVELKGEHAKPIKSYTKSPIYEHNVRG